MIFQHESSGSLFQRPARYNILFLGLPISRLFLCCKTNFLPFLKCCDQTGKKEPESVCLENPSNFTVHNKKSVRFFLRVKRLMKRESLTLTLFTLAQYSAFILSYSSKQTAKAAHSFFIPEITLCMKT